MSFVSSQQWESLEHWSASLLVIAGLVQLLNVILQVLPTVASLSVPEILRDLTLAAAGILAMLGLLGFAPQVRNEVPRLARAGSILAGLGIIGMLAVVFGEHVLGPFIGNPEQPPTWFAPILILYFVGVPVSFLVFGIASVRTYTPSRVFGAVLLFLFFWFLVFFHLFPIDAFIEGFSPRITELAIVLGFLASGYLLHTESTPGGSGKPPGEPTAG